MLKEGDVMEKLYTIKERKESRYIERYFYLFGALVDYEREYVKKKYQVKKKK